MCQKVLVVDDDQFYRDFLADFLEGEKFRVVTASNGIEGLAALEKDSDIDFLTVDVSMPILDGPSMLEKWQSASRERPLPILVISAESDPQTKTRVFNAGAHHFLDKLIPLKDLRQQVRDFVDCHCRCNVTSRSRLPDH